MQFALANRGRANYQCAVGNGIRNAVKLLCLGEKFFRPHGGTRLTKRRIVRIHNAQMPKAKIGHRPGGGPHVQRVARSHEDDNQAIEFSR